MLKIYVDIVIPNDDTYCNSLTGINNCIRTLILDGNMVLAYMYCI